MLTRVSRFAITIATIGLALVATSAIPESASAASVEMPPVEVSVTPASAPLGLLSAGTPISHQVTAPGSIFGLLGLPGWARALCELFLEQN